MIFLQANLQRSRAGFDLILKSTEDHQAHVILASEPNIAKTRKNNWYTNSRCNCAIKIMNQQYVKVKNYASGKCFVRVDTEDITIYSCYLSFNDQRETLEQELFELHNDILSADNRNIIIGGDFNAKSRLWNSPTNDDRGVIVGEWLSSLDMFIMNNSETPTFFRSGCSSFIDITACSQNLARRIKSWKVLLEENLSDHNSILFELSDDVQNVPVAVQETPTRAWRFKPEKAELLQDKIIEGIVNVEEDPLQIIIFLQNICEEVLPRKTLVRKNRKETYWWNSNIVEIRKNCHIIRRKIVRNNAKRPRNVIQIEQLRNAYLNAKKELRKAILLSQTSAWKKICEDLNDNIWGTGYKIVCKKLNLLSTKHIPTDEKLDIANKLFPQHRIEDWCLEATNEADIPPFTIDELLKVCVDIKSSKAPGPDGIGPEICKILLKSAPDFCLQLFNKLLKKGLFPNIWKIAKLVLIEKEKKPTDTETSYRPICLLDSLGKVFEKLIKIRLEAEIDRCGGLSPLQFGFRAGKSTVDAMLAVKNLAKIAKEKKQLCVLTMVDVRNAFNSCPWKGIIEEIRTRAIPKYIVNILASYLQNRNILVDHTMKTTSCGIPQGSVLAAVLWNIYYDPILSVSMPPNTKTIAYADDLVLLTTGHSKDSIELEIQLAMIRVDNWMRSKMLQLAPQKTEVVMLVSSRNVPEVTVEIGNIQIKSKTTAKYLGVVFDQGMRMSAHIKSVADKAEKVATNLSRIMPNVRGPQNSKRKMLAAVVYSKLFYGVPVWWETTKIKKYRLRLEKVQRKIMLRLCRAYRTVSTPALQVISGSLPIELMAEERAQIYFAKKTHSDMETYKSELTETLITKWQNKWNMELQKAQWTKLLIKNIESWLLRKHGDITYELCQFLTGHGNFEAYLQRMSIKPSDSCRYCLERDTPEHTIFHCVRWMTRRTECWNKLGESLTPNTIIEEMLKNKTSWDTIKDFIGDILRQKAADERSQSTPQPPMAADPP